MIDYCKKVDLFSELLVEIRNLLREFLSLKCQDAEERQLLLGRYVNNYNDTAINNNSNNSNNNNNSNTNVGKNADLVPYIIGQERSGLFIFSWLFEVCPYGKLFIASYNPTTKFSKLLLYQEKSLDVINASVNNDFTLLSFVCMEKESSCDYNGENSQIDIIYRSYIAEIMPQNRVFSLDVELYTYQRVQFLDSPNKQKQDKYRLLVFQHKDTIKIYSISVKHSLNKVIVTTQPCIQQIAGHFIWAKFDLLKQRLYYMQMVAKDEDDIDASGLINAVEFQKRDDFHYIINFIVSIPFKMSAMKKQLSYHHPSEYFSPAVTCKSVNMDILTSEGSFYVCFQHQVQENRFMEDDSDEEEGSVVSSTSAESMPLTSNPDAGCFVNYTVVCLHGGYSIKCASSFPISVMQTTPRLLFTLYNDYLLVHLPTRFLHLLDISCEHEPVHHLLVKQPELLPKFPVEVESSAATFSLVLGSPGKEALVLDSKNLTLFYQELNTKVLFTFFRLSKPSTRLSVLHACVNHFKDKRLTRNIMERVFQDPNNPNTAQMLKEYLVVWPYTQMKEVVTSQRDLKILPFTTQSYFRGQIERDANGNRDVYLSYRYFSTNLIRQLEKVLRNKDDEFWKSVLFHLKHQLHHKNHRVPLKVFHLAAVDEDSARNTTVAPSTWGRRNTTIVTAVDESTSDFEYSIVNFTSPITDDNALSQDHKENDRFNNVATECIVNYVSKYFGNETKIQVSDMFKEFMEMRNRTINSLWKSIVKSLNKTDDSVRYKNLSSPVDEYEVAIFQIVERLKAILDQLCYPRFPCMDDLLTSLAFRYLSRPQFFSYLDATVLRVDVHWVRRAIKELNDTVDNITLKRNLIMRLSRVESQKLLTEWNVPAGNRYLARQTLTRLPCESAHFKVSSFEEKLNPSQEEFIPLQTLLNTVKAHNKQIGFSKHFDDVNSGKNKMEFLSSSALAETKSLIS